MVPTAISHKNTSAVSTRGRSGEYSCTETEKLKTNSIHIFCKSLPASFGRRTAGIFMSKSVSFRSQTILHTMDMIDDYNSRSPSSFSILSFFSELTVSPLH
ncbi:Os02g0823050 [Oryza sativa Japonica Group]|uniref:Os02g0823050 protein n=1 Tax=Oryza sativa subsp. japonica TaxID=39947 RepID=A0A0P0VRE8_ORYSJ|nr:hypothetical protein EE612_014547 [Oryza sativa]BAS81655.1 Os02g0823050 [Oryza sativa Japonica Group]